MQIYNYPRELWKMGHFKKTISGKLSTKKPSEIFHFSESTDN